MNDSTQYIASITLDSKSLARRSKEIEHERTVAINDLIEWNYFSVLDEIGNPASGPYEVTVSANENRITFRITPSAADVPIAITLSIAPFRSIVRDYFMICESYFEAVKSGNLSRIEAIDMSRRGLHNEGAETLSSLLEEKVKMDGETARRLFTLLCALHLK